MNYHGKPTGNLFYYNDQFYKKVGRCHLMAPSCISHNTKKEKGDESADYAAAAYYPEVPTNLCITRNDSTSTGQLQPVLSLERRNKYV